VSGKGVKGNGILNKKRKREKWTGVREKMFLCTHEEKRVRPIPLEKWDKGKEKKKVLKRGIESKKKRGGGGN